MDQTKTTMNKPEMFQDYKSARLLAGDKSNQLDEILVGMCNTASTNQDFYDTIKALSVSKVSNDTMEFVAAKLTKKISSTKTKLSYETWHNMLDLLDLKDSVHYADLKDAIFIQMVDSANRALLYALLLELNQTGMYRFVNPKWFDIIEDRMLS